MQNTATATQAVRDSLLSKGLLCLRPSANKSLRDWTLDQLQVRPYQHILDVGFGNGSMLEEVARNLKIGFLAGIDPSMTAYQRVYAKNKKFIQQQLMQLHVGELADLPYPHHYFHTVYGTNIHHRWKDPAASIIQLTNLVRPGGRLAMVYQPLWSKDARKDAHQLQDAFLEAGLVKIAIDFLDMNPVDAVAIVGFKE